MIRPPVPVCLIVGKRFTAQPGEGASLRGILNGLHFREFPTRPTSLAVYFALTDGSGEGRLALEISEWRESYEPHVIYRRSQWYHFPSDPLMITNGMLMTQRLVFTRPGVHLIKLVFEDHLITERRFPIYQI